jgi:hypothetical protein
MAWYKPGASVDQTELDWLTCQQEALGATQFQATPNQAASSQQYNSSATIQPNAYGLGVALFESFMKDILAEVLRANPALLAKIKPDQQVKYKHIFTKASSFQAILNQEILREIDEVGRFSFQRRAEYFDKQLNLPMADEETLKFVGGIMEVRNEISHENPLKTISTTDLDKAVKALKQIPARVCTKAATDYGKNHFA